MSLTAFVAICLAIVVAFIWLFQWTLRLIDRALWNLSREDWPRPVDEPRNAGAEPVGERGD